MSLAHLIFEINCYIFFFSNSCYIAIYNVLLEMAHSKMTVGHAALFWLHLKKTKTKYVLLIHVHVYVTKCVFECLCVYVCLCVFDCVLDQ